MTIVYENTIDDILAASVYGQRHVGALRKTMPGVAQRGFLALIAAFIAFSLLDSWGRFGIRPDAGALFSQFGLPLGTFLGVSWLLSRTFATPRFARAFLRLFVDKDAFASYIGAYTLTLDATGLVSEHHGVRTSIAYPAIEQVDATQSHVFVFYNGPHSFAIPNAAFADSAQRQAFLDRLTRLRNGESAGGWYRSKDHAEAGTTALRQRK